MGKTFDYAGLAGTYTDCHFEVNRYMENNNLAVDIVGSDECIARVTVNMGVKLGDDVICVKTWSENANMRDFLVVQGFVEPDTGYDIHNGYVVAAVMRLTEKGKEYLGLKR